ncbi:exo-alpha-sialidase [Pleurocapsales cyanobacterium LEGE 06147]|nr:exo-alpha-sialidase [Pleurocapsales cyanobacterium LEGE 06147]
MTIAKQPISELSDTESNATAIAGTSEGLWFLRDSQQHVELKGHPITALASDNDGLWVVDDFKSVWKRDGEGRWNKVASIKDWELKCILPVQGGVLAGTSEAHLIKITNERIEAIASFEEAEGRNQWYTPWGGPPAVRSMAAGSMGELYVNVHVGGILRSKDGGKSWQPTIDLHSDVHQVLTVRNRPNLVLAATAQGLAISRDGGDSWQFDLTNLHATYSRAVTICGDMILMSVSVGPHGGKAALYRRRLDDSGTFEKGQQGLPEWFSDNINTGNLTSLGNRVAFGTSEGQIFISNDAGLTWKQIGAGLPPINCSIL